MLQRAEVETSMGAQTMDPPYSLGEWDQGCSSGGGKI